MVSVMKTINCRSLDGLTEKVKEVIFNFLQFTYTPKESPIVSPSLSPLNKKFEGKWVPKKNNGSTRIEPKSPPKTFDLTLTPDVKKMQIQTN